MTGSHDGMGTRHFLSLTDFSPEELTHVVSRAGELKRWHREGRGWRPLAGKTLAMVFELNSTRTRVAFEVGMHQLGGHAICLTPKETQISRSEPIEDTARVLAEMVDVVMLRTLRHEDVTAFAEASTVPVINGMSARFHPCQLLADVQTFEEVRGPIAGRTVAFVGDGYNMCHSYINASRLFGFDLRIATPETHRPDAALLAGVNSAQWMDSPREAVENADLVVTDVWSSMGHEEEAGERRRAFEGFQVTPALLDLASDQAVFMHCLPAHRGEEVSADMLDDPRSVVFTEAGNRLHSQKALLEFLVGAG